MSLECMTCLRNVFKIGLSEKIQLLPLTFRFASVMQVKLHVAEVCGSANAFWKPCLGLESIFGSDMQSYLFES